MKRNTIDFGIDLGTTNSEIACMDNGTMRIFKNDLQSEYTPSVVRIDEKGTIWVGRKAYERMIDDPENTVGEFKRWMGTQEVKEFKLCNKKLTPEELSAEVLKDLKISAKANFSQDEEIDCAVITVPCNFEIVQCEATQRAARLAGIQYAPLLQEPIAASIAYGFLEKMPKGYWVVFDLGGGTFDVAIMSSKEGSLSVVDHCGDNHLGGMDFDWKIVENIIHPILIKEYNLPNLGRIKEYKMLNAVLKNAAEEAKIVLSRRDEASIIIHPRETIKDKNNKIIDLVIPLKRFQFEPLIEDYIEKAIQLFEQVLKNQGLSYQDINQLILVGGPTQTPYLRSRLKEKFNIPTDYKIDPITVVAQGAAIFAAAQLLTDKIQMEKRDYSKVFIKLAYNPMTTEIEPAVGGRILPSKENKALPKDIRVQIVSTSGNWNSGLIETKDNAFFTNVTLREKNVNTFKLSLFDKLGNKIEVEPDSFTITQGMSVAEPPLIRSIGVELEDGTFDKHLSKGDRLPVRGKLFIYHTTKTVNPGEDKNALNIHVGEGESNIAGYNRRVGTLKITGSNIKRTLPEGSEIEIILSVDQSRHVTAEAFSQFLDQKFSEVLVDIIAPKLEPEHIAQDLKEEEGRLKKLKQEVYHLKDKNIEQEFSEEGVNKEINEIRNDIQAAKSGDPDAVGKADRGLKELKQKLDSIDSLLEWPIALKRYTFIIDDCKDTVSEHGNDEDKEQVDTLEKEAKKAIGNKDLLRLKKITEEIGGIRWAVLFRITDFWINAFQEIKENPGRFANKQKRAEELIEEGSIALQRQDFDSLKSIMWELWNLLPSEEEKSKVISDAGIRKR
jgi:molecular chaperone DnaK